jgi:hypothetical protein
MNDVYRLAPEVYEQLERQLPQPVVNQTTSEHMIGYMLGIQFVLGKLRQGFTVEPDNAPREQTFRTRAR